MDYTNMMKDCVSYMNRHSEEELTAEQLGKIYSIRGEFLSYIFSCYYEESLDSFIKKIKNVKREKKTKTILSPGERTVCSEKIRVQYKKIEAFALEASPAVRSASDVYHPIEAIASNYEDRKEYLFGLWWHDEEYRSHYMQGRICKDVNQMEEGKEYILIPAGRYILFSMEEKCTEDLAEELKTLVFYAHKKWVPQKIHRIDEQGYSFQCFHNGSAYYCLALSEREENEPEDKIYGVETWIDYIDHNLTGNLTITSLAKKFSYSTTHFKRVFRLYYKMSVADYIRKRRLMAIAEEIRQGVDYIESSSVYGFKTYTGFARAFKKEFHVSPAVYSRGLFEVIDLKKYYAQYKDTLRLTIVEMEPIRMIGHTVIPAQGDEVDIPAQVSYWIGKEFPCLKNTRFECNVAVREDKIALWHQEDDGGDIEYILGPVVDDFEDDIPEEMVKVTLEGGYYAIFETEKPTDEEDIAETLRMYTRCVFFGWVKEYRDRVDLNRLTFERYENGKIYLYVPVRY